MKPFTVGSLAEHLECSTGTIYNLINAGELVAFKVGKRRGWRIARVEVERWQNEKGKVEAHGLETSPSDDEVNSTLPTAQLKALASVSG